MPKLKTAACPLLLQPVAKQKAGPSAQYQLTVKDCPKPVPTRPPNGVPQEYGGGKGWELRHFAPCMAEAAQGTIQEVQEVRKVRDSNNRPSRALRMHAAGPVDQTTQ